MFPILWDFDGFRISTYGVIAAFSFIVGVEWSIRRARQVGLDPRVIQDIAFWLVVFGIVFTRLFYVVQNLPDYLADPVKIFKIWEGGITWYGGIIGGMIAVFWTTRRKGVSPWLVMDALAPGVALALMFARWGCFSAGCCYGKPTELPWSVVFKNPESVALLGVPIHPTQVYESVLSMFIFGVLTGYVSRSMRDRFAEVLVLLEFIFFRFYFMWFALGKGFPSLTDVFVVPAFAGVWFGSRALGVWLSHIIERREGTVAGMWFIMYPGARFFLEYLRDESGLSGWILKGVLTLNHVISIVLFAVGLWLVFGRRKEG